MAPNTPTERPLTDIEAKFASCNQAPIEPLPGCPGITVDTPSSVTLSKPIPVQPELTPQSKPKELYVAFRSMYGKETADEVFPGVAKKLHEEGLRQQAIIDKRKAVKKRERQAKKRNRR